MAVEFFASRTIFLSVGSLHITWYGIMYVAAFWGAWYVLPTLGRMRGVVLSRDVWTNIVAFGALGALIGGRIGYAVFYEPSFFLASPELILNIRNGGMSSHGGFIGTALGVWWAMRREGVSLLTLADIITVPAAIGLALGRIGNIVNQEFGLYPYYEAVGDVVIAVVCYVILSRSRVPFSPIGEKVSPAIVLGADEGRPYSMPPNQPSPSRLRRGALSPIGERGAFGGKTFAIFLILYSILRFLLEYIRPQEWPLFYGLSRGQVLTIPLLIVGMLLLMRAYKPIIQKPL